MCVRGTGRGAERPEFALVGPGGEETACGSARAKLSWVTVASDAWKLCANRSEKLRFREWETRLQSAGVQGSSRGRWTPGPRWAEPPRFVVKSTSLVLSPLADHGPPKMPDAF